MVNRLKKESIKMIIGLILIMIFGIIFNTQLIIAANPEGPTRINITSNQTKVSTNTQAINISGMYIANINVTATIQNRKWKAFVGNVLGSFTLADASGSSIYDWSFSTSSGRVYATRNSTSINWGNINCSNRSVLDVENTALSHSDPSDNITATFNSSIGASHASFYVGSRQIAANRCPTINTYIGNSTQDVRFEETALFDGTSIVYATILENNIGGYDNGEYDFQMIVPENGGAGFSGSTAYYLYIEIG
ncbi:MAG: hypothetical protein WC867_02540 [Candidatus Pacearchaeota archaeon]|jgi:hypothetical protein